MRLIKKYPQAEVAWRPVEAHPKSEEPEHIPYADLAVMGALFARDHAIDLSVYNDRMFEMYFTKHFSVDDPLALASAVAPLGIEKVEFINALTNGAYAHALAEANNYAYKTNKIWAVPAFIFGDKRLDSVEGVGVTETQLSNFLRECYG